jgi:MOSC domain-containing protein YiiM
VALSETVPQQAAEARINPIMLVAIFTALESARPMCSHESIEVVPTGLAGDRYATGKGYYSGDTGWDAHVTLIQQEPFDELLIQHGMTIEPKELRRNLVTKNINLKWLIGREFQVCETVILRGRKAWPPCMHIVKLTSKGEVLNYLAKQCGIGADVLVGGTIRVGDPVFALGKRK